ncbi:MAG: hypothetical protein ACPGRG_06030 [Marinomonas sp.]|jgi:hypothetical protein|uniref:hypothetical protein n=1 Tax=Marinomonas sp. TaxID=1904862 RepID=UPI003A93CA89
MPTKTNNTPKKEEEISTPKKKPKTLLITFFACFLLSVGSSSGITFYLMQSPSTEESIATNPLVEQSNTIDLLQKSLSQQEEKIQAMEQQAEVLKLYLRHSSSTALKNILIDQEQNIQAYLKVMKSAMAELSVLSSRTIDWNEKYQYQLDLALKGSLEREDLLKLLKTGEPNEQPSP